MYPTQVLSVPDELQPYLDHDGPPIPLIDAERGKCYMLMPVRFTKNPLGRFFARVPGTRAVGEADLPTEALATLALVIKEHLEEL